MSLEMLCYLVTAKNLHLFDPKSKEFNIINLNIKLMRKTGFW